MRRLAQMLLSSLFLVVFGGVCLATDVPKLTGVFNDATHIISVQKRDEITAFLKEQEERTSNQIVVLVVPTIKPDTNIAEYAGNVFNEWKLGQADKNNGVLVTFARKEGKMRITVGNGLQGALPDLLANRILEEEEIQSLLKETKFGSAILATVKAIDHAVGGEYQATPKLMPAPTQVLAKEAENSEGSYAFGFFVLFFFVMGTGVFVYFMFRSNPVGDESVSVPAPTPARKPYRGRGDNYYRPTQSRRREDGDDGFLPGVVVGSALSRSHEDTDSSRSYSPPSHASDPSPPSEPYSGSGGSTDSGGSGTSFDGGSGSGAD